MATLSAAELQRRHGLEGAPDPFPSLGGDDSVIERPVPSSTAPKQDAPVDTNSEAAFPTLGGSSSAAAPVASKWSSGAASSKIRAKAPGVAAPGGVGRTGAPLASSYPASISFSLPAASISGTPKTLQETMKKIIDQTGCTVEASTQMRTGLKTFVIRGPDEKKCRLAQKLIERGASKVETVGFDVPLSTLGTIIGPKGSTLKSITDATGVKIDIPKRDQLPSVDTGTNGAVEDSDSDAEPEDPAVTISLTGPNPSLVDAKKRIMALIHTKVSQTSVSIKDIPSSYYPFIAGPRGVKARQLEQTIGEDQVQVHVPPPAIWKSLERQGDGEVEAEDQAAANGKAERKRDLAIKVKGDKDLVARVVAEIRRQYEDLRDNARTLNISIPKRQHRFLVGTAADEILEQHGCIVELPAIDDPSDQCTIRGPASALVPALTDVMQKANAVSVETVDIVAVHRSSASDAVGHAKNVLRYLSRQGKFKQVADAHPGVKVYPPFSALVDSSGVVTVEIVGEDQTEAKKAKEELLAIVKSLTPSVFAPVEIDFAVHKFLIGKKGAKIAQFENTHSVKTVFPPPADESSTVLLVYTEAPVGDKKQQEVKVKESLSAATAALKDLAKEAADIKTETLDVPQKWHRHVIGPSGSVLRAVLGEDSPVNVSIGKTEQDVIVVRGPSTEVDRVVPQILQIVEDAKNDDIINGFTAEFSVEKRHVPHLVGSAGAAINKLKESLGVRVNFDDEDQSNMKRASKQPMVHCKIVGRKEAVEEAKSRLLAQVDRLADETTETLHIKKALHPALIGQSGKYAIRLEEKYGVKITFPREGKEGAAPQGPDEVVVRGGKKGVAGAKAELLEAAEFEKESNQSVTFTVPTSTVARILGKAGASINAIKDESGAQIDIDKTSDDKTTVTVKGDKKAIAAAKASILAIVSDFGDQTTDTVTIENKYHRTLIGPGGQKLRDLIVACGGPTEANKQAGMVNFPRQGDAKTDEVRLRGDKTLVSKLKAELEKAAAALRNQVVMGVAVPVSAHATRIGRGGSALMDLQKKTGATIQFPGSRQYNQVGPVDNQDEVADVDPTELVKVIGTKEQCAEAIAVLSTPVSTPTSRSQTPQGRRGGADLPTRCIPVANKYYHAVADGGSLARQLRQAGVQIDLPTPAPAKITPKRPEAKPEQAGAREARIDAEEGQAAGVDQIDYTFEVYPNYEGLGAEGDEEREWVLRGKEEVLDKGEEILIEAIERAKNASQIGVLIGIPRTAFPRIIGSKGATISRLRAETGADIMVGKEDDLITLTGDAESIGFAKEAILNIATRSGGRF